MEENNFWLDLIATLKKGQSKKQVQTDAKNLGDIKVPLIGTLNKAKTKAQIKQDLSQLNGTINLTGEINKKNIQNETRQAINNAQKVANSNSIKLKFDTDKQKLLNQIKILGMNNSKLFSNSEMSTKYHQLLDSANVAKSKSDLKNLRGELSAFRTELIATNNAGLTWGDRFKASISRYAQFFSGATFIFSMVNQLRKAATEAKTLDDRLVDLQKVADEINDRDALYKYFDRAMDKAQELNVKVDSLLYAITEFKKLGWSLSQAEIGGKWATILENVGDVNIDTAIGSIKTAIASFDEIGGYGNDQIDKKIEAYVDLINNMSNKYSIDAEGLSEAIRLSAGTLREAHTSIEQAATIFSTANRYFNDPDYLGNTLKIGSLRMRASSGDNTAVSELKEMGEEIDNLAEATSNLRGQLLSLTGVDIMVDEHTFKSYYDQLYEISQVIDDLNDTSRANVLETLFGKNRSAAGAAILSGMKESADAYKDAINSVGSATEEYEKWMQSADAASQRFANNLTKTYQSIINGNTVRDLTNIGSSVLEFANNWGIVEGTLKGILVLGVGKFLTTTTMAMITATKSVEKYGKALQLANNIPDGNLTQRYNALRSIAQATNSLTNAQLRQVLSSQSLTQQDRIRILQMSGLTKEMALQKLAEMGLTQATNAQTAANAASTASTFSLKSAMVGLGATMKSVFLSNPVGIALMAISVAIGAVTSAVSNYNQKLEEARQKAVELTNTYKEQQKTLDSQISKYKELKESLDKGNLSTDETRSIKEQLLEIQKSLIESYGNEASNIDLVNGKYKEQLELLNELSKEKATDYVIEHRDDYEGAKRELEKIRTYNLGTVTSWNSLAPKTEDQQRLLDYIESYSDLLKLTTENVSDRNGSYTVTGVKLSVEADAESANKLMHQFAEDLENWVEQNNINIDISGFLINGISKQVDNVWTDELEEYKTIYDEFLKAEIIRNDTLRPLYQQSIQAVEDYNEALSTGVGIDKARVNLEAIRQAVHNVTGELEGSQAIFDEIYGGINRDAESVYNRLQDSIRQISDDHGIVDREVYSTLTDYTKDFTQAQVELWLKATQGAENATDAIKKYEEALESSNYDFDSSAFISQLIDQFNTQLKPTFDSLKSAYQDIFTDDGFNLNAVDISMLDSIKSDLEDLNNLENVDININMDDFDTFAKILTDVNTTEEQAQQAFDDFATSIFNATFATEGMTDETVQLVEQLLESLGVVNANEVAQYALNDAKAQAVIASYDLVNASEDDYAALLDEAVAAGIATQQVYKLIAAEIAFGNNDLSVEQKIDKLHALASAYGDTASAALATAIANDLASGHTDVDSAINDLMTQINYGLSKVDVDFSGLEKSAKKAGSSAGSKAGESFADSFNNAISGVGKIIDKQISAYQKQKDAAVKALEAERDAAIEAIEAEIDGKQEVIDGIQDEIDAMKDANEERKRQLTLQQAQYDLERMQHQRTILQYSSEKGMHYVQDLSGTREAKEKVEDAKLDIEVANRQKQIDLLEKEIDLLEKRKDAINDYYDQLIEDTKNYWDSLIESLEEFKSRFDELADIENNAKLLVYLRKLGIETDDILNMSGEAFDKFKEKYLSALTGMYSGNDEILGAISESMGEFGDLLPPVSQKIDNTAESMDNLSGSSSTANKNVSDTAENLDTAATNAGALSDNLTKINTALSEEQIAFSDLKQTIDKVIEAINEKIAAIQEEQNAVGIATSTEISDFMLLRDKILEVKESISEVGTTVADLDLKTVDNITDSFQHLYDTIMLVSDVLGSGIEGSGESVTNSISSAIQALNEISLEDGIIAQFNNLKIAIDDVTSAIGGGDRESSGGKNKGGKSVSGNSGAGSKGTEGGSDSLTSSIVTMGETTQETLGESGGEGAIGKFEEFGATIAEAEGHVQGVIDKLNEVDGMHSEATITINIETNGSIPQFAEGTLGDVNFESGSFTAEYGKAHAEGYNGLPKAENNALVSEYGQTEMTVFPNGETVITDKPTMMDLPQGTVIFNEDQTKKILDNKLSISGAAHAQGTNDGVITLADGTVLRPLQPGDPMYDNIQKINAYFEQHNSDVSSLITPVNTIQRDMEQIAKSISTVNNVNNNRTQNITQEFYVTLPNVTDSTKATELMKDLQSIALKKEQFFNMR